MPGILGMFSNKDGYVSQVSGHIYQECEMHFLLEQVKLEQIKLGWAKLSQVWWTQVKSIWNMSN